MLNVECSMNNRSMIIKIQGEIDHHTSEMIREKIDKAYERYNAKNMIFDFSDILFMDSSGIGVIMGRYRNSSQKGGHVAVVHLQPQIERVFQLSGLHKIIHQFDSIDEAIKMLQ
ncbi:MAG: anti-sigma F factor antagonist [Epulopiscium sp.]|nr:anti-sigma F factor antagonist [Candidatus Epulonipiscium sp.]